jgi:uncharacterized protein YlaI
LRDNEGGSYKKGVSRLALEAVCMSCSKKTAVDPSESQYTKLKNGLTKLYICKACNERMKQDAVKSTGLDPKMLDPKGYDKLLP